MSTLLASLGLRASSPVSPPPPSHAATYIVFHFLFAYAILSTRLLKQYYGLDHNVSPREDLAKYGPRAVEKRQDNPKATRSSQAH